MDQVLQIQPQTRGRVKIDASPFFVFGPDCKKDIIFEWIKMFFVLQRYILVKTAKIAQEKGLKHPFVPF